LKLIEKNSRNSLGFIPSNRRPKPSTDHGSKPRTRTAVFPAQNSKRLGIDRNPVSINTRKLHLPIQPVSAIHSYSYAVNFLLPFDRRRDKARRPPFDFMRVKNPCVFFFLLLLGCRYVMDMYPPRSFKKFHYRQVCLASQSKTRRFHSVVCYRREIVNEIK